MNDSPHWAGIRSVIQASSVVLATALFLPGMLIRSAFQMLAARLSGASIEQHGFITELGGEVEFVEGNARWTPLLVAAVVGPLLIGSALLLPVIVPSAVLDVRPFAAISRDPSLVISHDTSLLPLLDLHDRFGTAGFLRLWFGVACFYCAVPPRSVLDGALAEQRRRRAWSPVRIALGPVLLAYRLLAALDTLLTFGFAGTYLASGLLILLGSWWFWTAVSRALF
jgi:hypothetical protein